MKASTNTSTTLLGKLKITQTYASNKCAKKSGHYLLEVYVLIPML